MLWKNYLITEAQWIPANNFVKPSKLLRRIEGDDPQEEKVEL